MSTADQDLIAIGQLRVRYLLDGAASGTAGMFELTVPTGAKSPPAHSHGNEEIIYGLEGVLRCTVGGEVREVGPGDVSYTPSGVVHVFDNPHDAPARVLVVNTPDIGAQYFRDVATAAAGAGGPDPGKIIEVMGRYGLIPAPPTRQP